MTTLGTTMRARMERANVAGSAAEEYIPGWPPRTRLAAPTCSSGRRWTRGKVTPLHQHPEADETFYMLQGKVRLHVDGEEETLPAGGIAIIPREVPDAFMVTTATARMLCLQTPGGGEAFYRQASEPAGDGGPPMPDFGRVRAAAAVSGAIEILGPPPF